MPRELPSLERLQELFHYDPETGLLSRRCHRPRSKTKIGDIVGTPNSDGHLVCRVDFQICYVHRIAWKMYYGKEPPLAIDHKNRKQTDNRIKNLRSANQLQNSRNRKLPKNSTTGILGVRFCKKNPANKWKAHIKANGKNIHLGYFVRKEDAIIARQRAERLLFGKFAPSLN